MSHRHARHGTGIAAAVILGLALLTPHQVQAAEEDTALEELVTWMTGTFSSAVQAADDPDFFDISLHMTPIWLDRDDGEWLYVEQAVREYQDQPYRQRVYRVREVAPGLFESQVFTLPDPGAAIGAWQSDEPLDGLTPEDLELREGCAILLRRRGETFEGSTLATLCTSSLRGASYATSDVVITPNGVVSWDLGFAADGGQVWGATKGGYVFDRIVDDSAAGAGTAADPDSDSDSEGDTEENGVESEEDPRPE